MTKVFNRVFYGWWIVGASFIIALYIGGAVFYGFTAIFEPIANEFGWSYAQVSLAASLRGFEEGLLVPVIGMLVDRVGPRRLIFSGALITAGGLFMLSRITSLGMFYAAYGIIALGMSFCTTTVLITAIANWFRGKVGTASGIAMCGFGFSGLVVPLIVRTTELYDWRTAIYILAFGTLLVVLPLSMVFRHKPEQYGCTVDGKVENLPTNGAAPSRPVEKRTSTREALRSGVFWRMVVAFTYHALVVSAIVTHVMPYLSSVGVSRSTSGMVATGIPLLSVLGRFSMGWLGDKINRRKVAAVGFLMEGIGTLCFAYVSSQAIWLLLPFLVLFGVGYGGATTLRPALGSEVFGRANFGAILGLLMGLNMVGSVTGPLLAGWTFDTWGAYQGLWFVLAAAAGIGIVLMLSIPSSKMIDDK